MGDSAVFETAREILGYAREELERAEKLRDHPLYRNAADKAFLALLVAVNEYIRSVKGFVPRSHSERRRVLREIGREDLRALYSDLMKTLHEEAFYEGVYQPDEVRYAIGKVESVIEALEREARGPPKR
ncbi:MAG: PaREP1 family protein [Thermofilaceae archaeon]